MIIFENGTTIIARIYNVSDFHWADFLVRIKQIEGLYIPLRDDSLSLIALLPASFHMYGSNYSRGILSETFQHRLSAKDVTTPSVGGMTVGCQFLNHGTKDFLVYGRHYLEVMGKLQTKGDVGYIQERILDRFIV